MRLRYFVAISGVAAAMLSSPAVAGCGSNCYQKVVTPPQYGTVAETVMVRRASVARHVSPAQYGTVHEQVIPAEYATHHRSVMVSPGYAGWQPVGRAY